MESTTEKWLKNIIQCVRYIRVWLVDTPKRDVTSLLTAIVQNIDVIEQVLPSTIYEEYKEYFINFSAFCDKCRNADVLKANYEMMISSAELFEECMEAIIDTYQARKKTCTCCGKEVVYWPLSSYYEKEQREHGGSPAKRAETINRDEYQCPECNASDRDRLLVSFLKRIELDKAVGGECLLQVAPAASIEHWIYANCPAITYHSTDLYMQGVTFTSDIQDMNGIEDESYDYFICSHVLEHVQDDRKAMKELCRILKKDGLGLFLVPLDLEQNCTDEEWGLPEEENWRRFGQGDHCRNYAKQDLLERLQNAGFYVHMLGKEFFGEDVFRECGLTDTSTLYVLAKQEGTIEELIQQKKSERYKKNPNQPLVSVILPTYNHEQYVEAAIESVLNQTYRNFEFLVADDGSADGTVEKIMQYEDKIDQIHLFEENTRGKVTNFLRELAKGKYIAVMHSDDLWAPDKLEMQVAYMENHPECGACFTACECFNDLGENLGNEYFWVINMKKEEWMRHFFDKGNCLAHPSILIHRDLYLEVYNKYSACMFWQVPDYWMWINLIQQKEIHVIEKALTFFRVHEEGSNANTSAPRKENDFRANIEETYIWYQTIKNMDAEYFLNTFKDRLIFKNASDEKEIMCEKLFILLKPRNPQFLQAAIFYMYDIYQIPGVKELLEDKYKWTREQIIRLTGAGQR